VQAYNTTSLQQKKQEIMKTLSWRNPEVCFFSIGCIFMQSKRETAYPNGLPEKFSKTTLLKYKAHATKPYNTPYPQKY
jgi:hypothetical protein